MILKILYHKFIINIIPKVIKILSYDIYSKYTIIKLKNLKLNEI